MELSLQTIFQNLRANGTSEKDILSAIDNVYGSKSRSKTSKSSSKKSSAADTKPLSEAALKKMKVADLKAVAKRLKLTGYSSLKKDDMIKFIQSRGKTKPKAVKKTNSKKTNKKSTTKPEPARPVKNNNDNYIFPGTDTDGQDGFVVMELPVDGKKNAPVGVAVGRQIPDTNEQGLSSVYGLSKNDIAQLKKLRIRHLTKVMLKKLDKNNEMADTSGMLKAVLAREKPSAEDNSDSEEEGEKEEKGETGKEEGDEKAKEEGGESSAVGDSTTDVSVESSSEFEGSAESAPEKVTRVMHILTRANRDGNEPAIIVTGDGWEGLSVKYGEYLRENREMEDYMEDEEFEEVVGDQIKLVKKGKPDSAPELHSAYLVSMDKGKKEEGSASDSDVISSVSEDSE